MTSGSTMSVAGVDLFIEDTGEAELPAVLCLHSLFLDGRMFDGFTTAAAGTFRVVRPDFRGQGRSTAAGEASIGMDLCSRDVAALVARLRIASAHLLVSSMGGDVGLRLAAQRPDLVRSIVVVGSSAREEPPEQLERFRAWVDEAARSGFTGETLDTTMAIMFGETTRNDPANAAMLDLWRERIAALPRALGPAMKGVIERESVVPLLSKIAVPALVISGEECIARPPDWAAELARGLPNAEFLLLPKIGHSPLLETPATVVPRILSFFASVESARRATG